MREHSNASGKHRQFKMVATNAGDVKVNVDDVVEPKSKEIPFEDEGRIELNTKYWRTPAGKLRKWQIVSD